MDKHRNPIVSKRAIFIKIYVYEKDKEEPIRNLIIDTTREGCASWLHRLILWATTNGMTIEIVNIVDNK